jgi:hypothetical protein
MVIAPLLGLVLALSGLVLEARERGRRVVAVPAVG